jgi:hypothetical protein
MKCPDCRQPYREGEPHPKARCVFNQATMQEPKYRNESSLCSKGHSHRSKLESAVCAIIQLREKAGELELLQVEDHIQLSGWYTYVVDFRCRDLKTGEEFWIEAKGSGDKRWPSTRKGWKHSGPGKLEVWKGDHWRPILVETIYPKEKP